MSLMTSFIINRLEQPSILSKAPQSLKRLACILSGISSRLQVVLEYLPSVVLSFGSFIICSVVADLVLEPEFQFTSKYGGHPTSLTLYSVRGLGGICCEDDVCLANFPIPTISIHLVDLKSVVRFRSTLQKLGSTKIRTDLCIDPRFGSCDTDMWRLTWWINGKRYFEEVDASDPTYGDLVDEFFRICNRKYRYVPPL